jgi:hypothetical protein
MAIVALLALMSPLIAVTVWLVFRPVTNSTED